MTNIKPGEPIQAAINAGDVKLLAGDHAPGIVNIPSNRAITCDPGAVLKNAKLNIIGVSNVTLTGIAMDGGDTTAITIQNAHGVHIDGLAISNVGDCGIYVNAMTDSWIRGSTFTNIGGRGQTNTAIFGYDPARTDISHNKFKNCGEGVHFFWTLGDKVANTAHRDDVTIDDNVFEGVRRHPIELQEGVRGLKVRRNWIGGWTSAIKSIIGISAALGGDPKHPGPQAWEIEICNNVIDGFGLLVTDPSQFMGIEVMGDTINVHHNDINNMGQPIAVTYNTTNTRIADNNVRGIVRPPRDWWKDDKGIIVADQPSDHYVPVIDTGNRWSTDPMPGPPTDNGDNGGGPVITNVVATEANPPVVTWTGGPATVTRTDKDGKTDVKADGSPAVFANASSPFTDTFIPKDHYDNTWHVRYNIGGTVSNTIQLPKPAVTPPPPDDSIASIQVKMKSGKVTTFVPQTVQP